MLRSFRELVAVAWQVQERYRLDAADQLAAAIAYFAFVSFVPLLLLAVSVVGFVLSDPEAQLRVAMSLTQALPGFEETVEEPDSQVRQLLEGVVAARGTVGIVGLVTLLFTGLKVLASAMTATRVVFRGEVLRGVGARVRQLLAMVVLGLTALLAVAGSSLGVIGLLGDLPGGVRVVVSLGVAFVFDLLLFLTAYTVLSPSAQLTRRQLLPGAILAATGWSALKVVSSTFIAGQIDSANAVYGALGSVFALLLLLYLAGRLYLYGAELSAVLYERAHGPLEALHGPHEPAPDPVARLAEVAAQARSRLRPDAASDTTPDTTPDTAPDAASDTTRVPPLGTDPAALPGTLPSATPVTSPPPAPEPGRDARTTAALALAAAALVAVWRFRRP